MRESGVCRNSQHRTEVKRQFCEMLKIVFEGDFSNSGTLTRKLELRKMSDIYLPVKIIGSSLCDFQFNQSINDLAKMVCFIETHCC